MVYSAAEYIGHLITACDQCFLCNMLQLCGILHSRVNTLWGQCIVSVNNEHSANASVDSRGQYLESPSLATNFL